MRALKIACGLIVTAFFVTAIATHLDTARFAASFSHVGPATIVLALACVVGGYGAKIWRWQTMLTPLTPGISLAVAGQTLLSSVALNNVLPLRAGDVARAIAFRRELGAGPTALAGLLVLERLLDTAMLIGLAALIAVAMAISGQLPTAYRALPVLGVVGLVVLVAVLGMAGSAARWVLNGGAGSTGLSRKVVAFAGGALHVIADHMRGVRAVNLLGLTAMAWLLEAGLFATLAAGFGISTPLLAGGFTCALATLSTMIPSAPGFFGTFHAAAIAAVMVFGATFDEAAAYALLAHGLLWLPTTLVGGACLLSLSQRGALSAAHVQPGSPSA